MAPEYWASSLRAMASIVKKVSSFVNNDMTVLIN